MTRKREKYSMVGNAITGGLHIADVPKKTKFTNAPSMGTVTIFGKLGKQTKDMHFGNIIKNLSGMLPKKHEKHHEDNFEPEEIETKVKKSSYPFDKNIQTGRRGQTPEIPKTSFPNLGVKKKKSKQSNLNFSQRKTKQIQLGGV